MFSVDNIMFEMATGDFGVQCFRRTTSCIYVEDTMVDSDGDMLPSKDGNVFYRSTEGGNMCWRATSSLGWRHADFTRC